VALVLSLLIPGPAQTSPPEAESSPDAGEAELAGSAAEPFDLDLSITGSVSGRYHWRFSDEHEDDHDLYEYLRLQLGEPSGPGLSGSFHGRLTQDLDGKAPPREFATYNDILDTYDTWVHGRVYHLYGTYRPDGTFLDRVTVGRQYVMAGELLHVDGGEIVLRPMEDLLHLDAHVFGGVPVHMYEDELYDGDWVVGAGLSLHPWDGGRGRFDYVHIGDENDFYESTDADLFTFSLNQTVAGWINAYGSYQHLDEDPRLVTAGFDAAPPDLDLHVRASWRGLLSPQKDLVYDLDPYYAIARNLEPYWEAHVAAGVGLGENLHLEGGAAFRQLFDEGDEGLYNREFGRYYATLLIDELLVPELSLAVGGELWDATLDDGVGAMTFDLTYEATNELRLTLGSDFALWRLDFFTGDEDYDSQSYYLKADWRPGDAWRFDLSVGLEDDDYETGGFLRSGIRFNF
jgi:hypothetical protein